MTADTTSFAGFSHVAVVVDDLDAALTFYCDLLGFEVLPRPEEFGPGAWLQVGSSQLHIGVVDQMPAKGSGFPPHFALHVPGDVYDATIEAIGERAIPFVMGPSAREDFGRPVRAAFIQDPAGNTIELTDVDPRPTPPERTRESWSGKS